MKAISGEVQSLEDNGVWNIVKAPESVQALNSKWVFKTKRDAEGDIARLKVRLVACENEKVFGLNFGVIFCRCDRHVQRINVFFLSKKTESSSNAR